MHKRAECRFVAVADELYFDLAILLKKNGYPPTVIDEAYGEVLKQVENFKKYEE